MASSKSNCRCDMCKKTYPANYTFIVMFDEVPYSFCAECYPKAYTCHTCVDAPNCAFQADRSEPQVVQKTIRQGGMVMSTQVKNPNLVEKHCVTCRCSHATQNNQCLKDSLGQSCTNWRLQKAVLL